MSSGKRQPKYTGVSMTSARAEPRRPIDAKALKDVHIKQAARLLQVRVEGLDDLIENELWGSLVEAARGIIEGGRVLLEEVAVREAIDSVERGIYEPLVPREKDGGA